MKLAMNPALVLVFINFLWAVYMIFIGHVPITLESTLYVPLTDFAVISKRDGETLYECTFLIERVPKYVG